MLECVLASHDVAPDHHRAILSYANHVLLHLTDTLQEVADAGEDLLPRCDQYWLNFFVENLSDLVNIVTEEPAFPVRALFPADRIVALERAFVAVQHLIVHMGLVEVESRIGNRAGYRETCEDKLVRLRALRSRSESPQQETTPPGINLATYVISSSTRSSKKFTDSAASIAGPGRLRQSQASHLPRPLQSNDLLPPPSRQLPPIRSKLRLSETNGLLQSRLWTPRRMLPSQSNDSHLQHRGRHRTTASRTWSCTLRRNLCTAIPYLRPSWSIRPLLPFQ